MGWVVLLNRESGQFNDLSAFESGLMGTEADAGPIRGLLRVREGIAVRNERGQEFMDEMWMRTTMTCALSEA